MSLMNTAMPTGIRRLSMLWTETISRKVASTVAGRATLTGVVESMIPSAEKKRAGDDPAVLGVPPCHAG